MLNKILGCIKKDILEYKRTHRNFLFLGVLISISIFVILITKILPYFINIYDQSNMINNMTSLTEMLNKSFPISLKSSLGIFASDMVTFYLTVVIIIYTNVIHDEMKKSKILMPIVNGYSKNMLIISKEITYGFFCSTCASSIYFLHFFLGSIFLNNDINLNVIINNMVVIFFSFFCIINIVVMLSYLIKNKFIVWSSILPFTIILPDLMNYFNIGKYFPTYIFTYLYNTYDNINTVIIPLIVLIIIDVFINIYTFLKKDKMFINER